MMINRWSTISDQSSEVKGALRTGISMLEVLISIGIVAIGLVSIAALIPVGGIQVQKSNIEERKATLGLNAFREFQVRGIDKVANSNRINDTTYVPANDCYWQLFDGTPFFSATVPHTPAITSSLNVAIDPLMVASAASAAGNSAIKMFPANSISGAPAMTRLGLSIANTPALAQVIFTAADDVVTSLPNDTSQPGSGAIIYSDPPTNSIPLKRDFNGEFTWLATLTPYYPDAASSGPALMNQFTLSVVVFSRRVLSTPSPGSQQEEQLHCTVSPKYTEPAAGTVSISGGDLILGDASAHATDSQINITQPGGWIMLCRGDATAGSIFKWYRIVTASSDGTDLQITVAGPDWVWGGSTYPTYACLFDGAVAVYQRVIHLEGPSVWSQ